MSDERILSTTSTQQTLINDLRELLLEGNTATQEDICKSLEAKGHAANQSKVSRLLRKISAIKSKNELGEIVYRLPREPAPPTTACQLSSLIIDIVANETTIVVNTSPGSAQVIARLIDHHKHKLQIIGTIAGDDAIFIMPKSIKKIAESVKEIKNLLFE